MFFKNPDYKFIFESNDEIVVKVKTTGKIITVTKDIVDIILDTYNDQYNSDHRYVRHQDQFFAFQDTDSNTTSINEIADRSSIETTSTYFNIYQIKEISNNE
ncbi:hypothetical protein [Lactobacillus sp. ESL0703]|uniref:hypothetical protein n=1 Tax=Lactobacillus sp. ESL0703 TaxID=2983218 RepID=UPI0023F80EBB|nr:hypothetical protein [Lactobacillus sp. ESL0703]MDF7669331.1 hypothetical protein [Lactobacillus sp. ESL0703]